MATLTAFVLVCVLSVMRCDAGIFSNLPNISLPGLPKIPLPFNGHKGSTEEHGNLAGIGRDIIKGLESNVGGIVGGMTKGLDTDKTLFGGVVQDFKKKIQAIYPGTRWCGAGNRARTEEDLGYFSNTDKCCREHDNCPDSIEKDGSKHNLNNTGLFTRSNCACDKKFYDCLKAAHDPLEIATQIGTTYFTILGPQCFKKEYPILKCIKHQGLTNRCVDYQFDKNGEKIYQWFDNPQY